MRFVNEKRRTEMRIAEEGRLESAEFAIDFEIDCRAVAGQMSRNTSQKAEEGERQRPRGAAGDEGRRRPRSLVSVRGAVL